MKRFDFGKSLTTDQVIAFPEGSPSNQQNGRFSEAGFDLGFDDGGLDGAFRVGGELQHFGLGQNGLDQVSDVGAVQRRDGDSLDIAAIVFKLKSKSTIRMQHSIHFGNTQKLRH